MAINPDIYNVEGVEVGLSMGKGPRSHLNHHPRLVVEGAKDNILRVIHVTRRTFAQILIV